MEIKKDIIEKDFSIFNGKLKSLLNENIGLEYFLISNYSFFNYNLKNFIKKAVPGGTAHEL